MDESVQQRIEENNDLVAAALREAAHQYKPDVDDLVDVDREGVRTLYELADDIDREQEQEAV